MNADTRSWAALVDARDAVASSTDVVIIRGTFGGPRFPRPAGGGDWTFTRDDGVLELDVRIPCSPHDGARVHVTYRGLRHGAPEVLAAVARGKTSSYYFRIAPVFEMAAPAHAFLNRMICAGSGFRRPSGPVYTVYEIL